MVARVSSNLAGSDEYISSSCLVMRSEGCCSRNWATAFAYNLLRVNPWRSAYLSAARNNLSGIEIAVFMMKSITEVIPCVNSIPEIPNSFYLESAHCPHKRIRSSEALVPVPCQSVTNPICSSNMPYTTQYFAGPEVK